MQPILGVLPRIKLSDRSYHFFMLLSWCGAHYRVHLTPLQSVQSYKVCETCKSTSLQKWYAHSLKKFKPCISEVYSKFP